MEKTQNQEKLLQSIIQRNINCGDEFQNIYMSWDCKRIKFHIYHGKIIEVQLNLPQEISNLLKEIYCLKINLIPCNVEIHLDLFKALNDNLFKIFEHRKGTLQNLYINQSGELVYFVNGVEYKHNLNLPENVRDLFYILDNLKIKEPIFIDELESRVNEILAV